MTPQRWQVLQGDCLELMRSLPDGSVSAVVTDPPYGIGNVWKGGDGNGWGKTQQESVTRNEWDAAPPPPEVWAEIFRVSKKVVIWGGNYFPLPPSRCWLVWVKPERGFTLAEAELAWTNLDAVVRCFDQPRHIKDRQHPTQKPVNLMHWSLSKLDLQPEALVLDPFCGSGTTGVACALEGYRFIGMEREEQYCEIARRRIEAAYAQGKLDLFDGLDI